MTERMCSKAYPCCSVLRSCKSSSQVPHSYRVKIIVVPENLNMLPTSGSHDRFGPVNNCLTHGEPYWRAKVCKAENMIVPIRHVRAAKEASCYFIKYGLCNAEKYSRDLLNGVTSFLRFSQKQLSLEAP